MNVYSRWLWMLYVLLFLAALCPFYASLFWLWIVVLLAGYVGRHFACKAEDVAAARHLTWQIRTVWQVFLIWSLGLAFTLAVAGWMDRDGTVNAQLDALIASPVPPMEALKQMWSMPGVKALVLGMFTAFVLSVLLPLKRTLHGMLALRRELSPQQPNSGAALALALAVLLTLALYCLSLM